MTPESTAAGSFPTVWHTVLDCPDARVARPGRTARGRRCCSWTIVPTVDELYAHRERALALGARELLDRSDDPDEPLFVLADPAGHPFCIFVAG